MPLFSRGGAVKSSRGGDCLPTSGRPLLIDRYESGRIDLGEFGAERIRPYEVGSASGKMRRGEVLRSVVVL